MANDGTVKIGTELDKKGLEKGLSGIGSFAKKGAAVFAGTAAAGVAAFAAITKSSLDAVAQLEQNVGGVETLFKDSAQTVIDNANKAYKTAGLSANAYMSTVTSFSASLLQSLSGNTAEAAKMADMAIVDMSDNANKMGTSMDLIQNAYQGFAKQNYTMLDNLKLGYGGTKTEMERLLADAQKLSGVKYDINNLSDVYQAIHVIQTELGITGTTAKEAATTIEGSMNSAKAAWQNFLAGTATAEELVASVGTAASVVGKNLAQIIPRLAETIPEAASLIANAIVSNLPQFASMGLRILENIGTGITNGSGAFLQKGTEILSNFTVAITNALPQVASVGIQLLQQLGSGLQQAIPEFLANALPILQDFTAMLLENAGQLVDAGIQFIYNIVDGLITALPDLIAYVPTIVKNVADIINQNLPKILLAGANIIKKLLTGIIQNIPNLIAEFPKLVSSIISVIGAVNWLGLGKSIITGIWNGVKALFSSIPNTIKSIATNAANLFRNTDWRSLGTTLINKVVSGITSLITSIPSKIKSIVSNAKSAFTSVDWLSIGKNIISGVASGVANFAGNLVDAAVNAAKNAIDTVKGWLGIHSPSRRARDEIGVNMIAGVSEGVEKETPHLEASSEDSARSAVHAMRRVSAKEFVSDMQRGAYRAAENNEMAARSKARNNGYNPDNPDDETLIIHNEFNVDGEKLVDRTVRKTRRQIEKEQRAARMAKGDVVFA